MRKKVLIMGAAGRDFHNFNVFFRDNHQYEVIGFTATQIPDIEKRRYPHTLAGNLYPNGIPIYPERELKELIYKHKVDLVVFAYSDVSHEYVMHCASLALSCGADYMLLGPKSTMLKSRKPVVAVGAIRTGCGKSQTTIKLVKILTKLGKKVVVVRHPMPYKDWNEVQRFESYEDLKKCTIEEREEFEPLLREKVVAFEGVDYEKILHKAEEEGDIILWDGGNNDFPFYKPDLFIVVVDPLRPGDEHLYHPGETCLRMANVVIINKIDSAKEIDIKRVRDKVKELNPKAQVIEAKSPITLDNEAGIKDKDILIVEDGPTLTHGEMEYGAGFVAAKKFGARKIIDPRPYAIGSIAKVYEKYSSTGNVLPAMGYSAEQIKELETTINNSPCDTVIIATPSDIRKFMTIKKPCVKVTYKLEEISSPNLEEILTKWLNRGV